MSRVSAIRTSFQSIIKKATAFVSHKSTKLGADVPDSFASSKASKLASEAEDALDSFQVPNPVNVVLKAGESLGALPSKIEPLGDSKEDLLLKYSINVLERANGANVEKMPRPVNYSMDVKIGTDGHVHFTNYTKEQVIPHNRLPDTIEMFKNLSVMKNNDDWSSYRRIFTSESLFDYARLASTPEHFKLIEKLAPYSKNHEWLENDYLAGVLRTSRTPRLLKFATDLADCKYADGSQAHCAYGIKSIFKSIGSAAIDTRKEKEYGTSFIDSMKDSTKLYDDLVEGNLFWCKGRKFLPFEAAKLAYLANNRHKINLVSTLAQNPEHSSQLIAKALRLSDKLSKSKIPIDDYGNILVNDPAVYWYKGAGFVIVRESEPKGLPIINEVRNVNSSESAKLVDWDDIYDGF